MVGGDDVKGAHNVGGEEVVWIHPVRYQPLKDLKDKIKDNNDDEPHFDTAVCRRPDRLKVEDCVLDMASQGGNRRGE